MGRGQRDDDDYDDDEEEEELESILFLGAINGQEVNLKANARLVRAGLPLVKQFLTDAVSRRSQLVLVDPKGARTNIRFVIDGVPYPGARLPGKRGFAATQMIKLLAGLDIQQRLRPQSGGLHATLDDVPYELLVESTPIADGVERLAIQIHNQKEKLETPEEVGFPSTLKAKIREFSSKKRKAILTCGLPHSGTTTTKMASLRSVDVYLYSIFSIADLGGKEIPHLVDFPVDPEDDFTETLRKVERKESDLLLMNPIHTAETAKNLFTAQEQMAVISEFTARDTAHGIVQLCQWLGDPERVANGLAGILSQKLIRLLCDDCKVAFRPHPKILKRIKLPPEIRTLYRVPVPPPPPEDDDEEEEEWRPCRTCNGVGYLGQTGLFEFIEMVEEMQQLVAKGPTASEIKQLSRQLKMPTFQSEGLRLVVQGKTSLDELQRVFK